MFNETAYFSRVFCVCSDIYSVWIYPSDSIACAVYQLNMSPSNFCNFFPFLGNCCQRIFAGLGRRSLASAVCRPAGSKGGQLEKLRNRQIYSNRISQ